MMTEAHECHDLLMQLMGFDAATRVDDEASHYCDSRSELMPGESDFLDLC